MTESDGKWGGGTWGRGTFCYEFYLINTTFKYSDRPKNSYLRKTARVRLFSNTTRPNEQRQNVYFIFRPINTFSFRQICDLHCLFLQKTWEYYQIWHMQSCILMFWHHWTPELVVFSAVRLTFPPGFSRTSFLFHGRFQYRRLLIQLICLHKF